MAADEPRAYRTLDINAQFTALRDGEIGFTVGSRGPDGQQHITARLKDAQAVDVADLYSMIADLERTISYCEEYDRQPDDQRLVRAALAEAAVVAYGRCHTSGRSAAHRRARRIMPRTLIDKLPADLLQLHQQYKDRRDQEVGHRAGAGEHAVMLAYREGTDGPVAGVGPFLVVYLDPDVNGLARLAAAVLDMARQLADEEHTALLERLRTRGLDQA